jgi:spore germination protein
MKQLFCQLLIFPIIIFSNECCKGEKSFLSWCYVVHTDYYSMAYLREAASQYDILCVTGFVLVDTGQVTAPSGSTYASLKALSLKHGFSIYPLISLTSREAGIHLLSSEHGRRLAARGIASLAEKNGFRGIHLDIEYLPPAYAPRLGLFLENIRREYSGTITVAVFPQIGFPRQWSGFHDLAVIAPRVDQIIIMCYDLHGVHTGPGPVTDVAWADENIRHAIRYIDSRNIWLGVPAYGYRWCGTRIDAVSSRQAVKRFGVKTGQRDPSGTILYLSGDLCKTYISDRLTRSLLDDLARRRGCAGTAMWRLGFED